MPGCKVATISVSIPAPADTTLSRRHLEIGAKLLERDFAEPRIRKSLGAYGAQVSWRNNSLRLASFQNPDIGDTLGLVRSIRDFVAKVKWTADDVRQTMLTIASRFVNRSQSPYGIASQCLDESIEGRNPAHIREGLKTIAEMKPDDIKETLLEALDAGMGSETIRVEAPEKTITEANSHLPEGLKLHITGA